MLERFSIIILFSDTFDVQVQLKVKEFSFVKKSYKFCISGSFDLFKTTICDFDRDSWFKKKKLNDAH